MRTTLTLEDDVAARIRRLLEDRDTTLKGLVNEVLRRGLDAVERPPEDRPRFLLRPRSLGRALVPSLDNVAEVLALAEGEDHR